MKKGPGRRPMSEKRAWFVDLRARGWSIVAAARDVGVSRSTGKNWHRGAKYYRNGIVAGTYPPLDRLEVRHISDRFLSQDERVQIADLHRAGMSIRRIGATIGRAPSTISRELRRNRSPQGWYGPFDAHRQAVRRRARRHGRRIHRGEYLRQVIGDLLAARWSPGQIARQLPRRFPDDPSRWLCHESIYRAVYDPESALIQPRFVAPFTGSVLRTGRAHRRAHYRGKQRRPRFEQPMLSIRDRPFPAGDRSEPGHWEGDLIIGRNQGSAIGTLVERTTRTVRLLYRTGRDSDTLHGAIRERMSDLPPELFRSITWDQGIEMARHRTIAMELGIDVFFADPHSPWQRGSNENTNGLPRQYFPKKTDLRAHSAEHLRLVENELNNRPRQILDDQSQASLLDALLRSSNHRVLQR